MRTLRVDFAKTSGWHGIARWQQSLIVVLGMGLLAASVALLNEVTAIRSLKAQIAVGSGARSATSLPSDSLSLSSRQLLAVNGAIRRMNLPWRDLFDAIEQASVADIALLSLEPLPETGRLVLTAQARTPADMLAYVQRLQRQAILERVELLSHQVDKEDPVHPLQFTLSVLWRLPDAPGGQP